MTLTSLAPLFMHCRNIAFPVGALSVEAMAVERGSAHPRDEIDLVGEGVVDVLAQELTGLAHVLAIAAANVVPSSYAGVEGQRQRALRADERAVRQHLGAVADEALALVELAAADVALADLLLARVPWIWRYVKAHL